jgi:hypothetical protein
MSQHNIQDLLDGVQDCLHDASVLEVSPRFRFFAAQDAAVLAAIIIARMNGDDLGRHNLNKVFEYLRSHSLARSGLRRHVQGLGRFDRDDYDNSYRLTQADANRALVSAIRVYTALRWELQSNTGDQKGEHGALTASHARM